MARARARASGDSICIRACFCACASVAVAVHASLGGLGGQGGLRSGEDTRVPHVRLRLQLWLLLPLGLLLRL